MVAAVLVAVGACALPRDADGTLTRARHGTIRVGVIDNPPWVIDSAGRVSGIEGDMVTHVAAELGAHIEWVRQSQGELMQALTRRDIDVVIGGLTSDLPWSKTVAFTRPYYTDTVGAAARKEPHVIAAAAGENAWLMYLEARLPNRDSVSRAVLRSRSLRTMPSGVRAAR